MTTIARGQWAVLAVWMWLLEQGALVAPAPEGARFDLLVNRGDGWQQWQVKAAHKNNDGRGHYRWQVHSSGLGRTPYEVEDFSVLAAVTATGTIFLLPREALPGCFQRGGAYAIPRKHARYCVKGSYGLDEG